MAGRLEAGLDDDGAPTVTSEEQREVEQRCERLSAEWIEAPPSLRRSVDRAALYAAEHAQFMHANLRGLPRGFSALDASRAWVVFWSVHGLRLLGKPPPGPVAARVCDWLRRCQHPDGGFGGGPGQMAHLATTYASVMALASVGTDEALGVVDRPALLRFLLRCKQPDGSFAVHDGGETDTRGAYTALAVASLTGVLEPRLSAGTAAWLASCQTYEGGLGAEPGNEAHSGYTYCGLAALVLLGAEDRVDLPLLARWAAQRQMPLEGGFQGRTNKLVDSCYSFWCGALFPLLAAAGVGAEARAAAGAQFVPWAMSAEHLERYVMLCCQSPHGGLRDKPGKGADPYHTCYALSGLSTAQHAPNGHTPASDSLRGRASLLEPTSPVYNIVAGAAERALAWYSARS